MRHLRVHHKPSLTLVKLPDQCSGEPVVSYLSTTFSISMYAESACNIISHALDMEDNRCNILKHTISHPLPQPSSSMLILQRRTLCKPIQQRNLFTIMKIKCR